MDPEFSQSVLTQIRVFPVTVLVKTRISETGDVANIDLQGGNPILYDDIRVAVEKWKFLPAITEEIGARCVDAEIPVTIRTRSGQ